MLLKFSSLRNTEGGISSQVIEEHLAISFKLYECLYNIPSSALSFYLFLFTHSFIYLIIIIFLLILFLSYFYFWGGGGRWAVGGFSSVTFVF